MEERFLRLGRSKKHTNAESNRFERLIEPPYLNLELLRASVIRTNLHGKKSRSLDSRSLSHSGVDDERAGIGRQGERPSGLFRIMKVVPER